MTRNPDILFTAEYIKNVLYFATVRQGKALKSTPEIHYFSVDNELVYENYYSDFGPLNLGCVFKYCKILNEKLKQFLNKSTIVHYTSAEARKKANGAFLIGCYGVLYLSLTPKDALKPLILHGQNYRPFQDATQGDSNYTITLLDCLCALKKARDLGFFSFQDFNYEEYERLDKIQGGDLNWIVPGKFLAFIGPVDYSVSLYHPPEMYIEYFKDNNVKIVIRLNKRMYDGNVFNNAGIMHYDLFFPDGSYPPRHILLKFLQIAEESDGAIAVHCKAGLGRTGSLIGSYLMKHYRMTAHEAIGWMRICRPGSVIGHQQDWLERMEPWLIKQGILYRKRTFQDAEKLPIHEFGVYSISEKVLRQRPVMLSKSPSPPPPIQRQTRSDTTPPARPHASKLREETTVEEEEVFITEMDLTVPSVQPMGVRKGCVLKNDTIHEEYATTDYLPENRRKVSFWKKYLCCQWCSKDCDDCLWKLAVDCAIAVPMARRANACCDLMDRAALNKASEKDQYEWRLRSSKTNTNNGKTPNRGVTGRDSLEAGKPVSRRGSGAGEPRQPPRPAARTNTARGTRPRDSNEPNPAPLPTFRTTQGPVLKTINDAKSFLMRSSLYSQQRESKLNQSITVTPQYTSRQPFYPCEPVLVSNLSAYGTKNLPARGCPGPPRRRLCLGRSPSPSPSCSPARQAEHSRATNTSGNDKFYGRDSKVALREALSRLKPATRGNKNSSPTRPHSTITRAMKTRDFLVENSKTALLEALSKLTMAAPRDGSVGAASVGAASLGARRDAPAAKRAPSVRSDERPLATQGDMLNSIKFQRRFRDTLNADKISAIFNEKANNAVKDKTSSKIEHSRISLAPRLHNQDISSPRDKNNTSTSKFYSPPRPTSPKGRTRTPFY